MGSVVCVQTHVAALNVFVVTERTQHLYVTTGDSLVSIVVIIVLATLWMYAAHPDDGRSRRGLFQQTALRFRILELGI